MNVQVVFNTLLLLPIRLVVVFSCVAMGSLALSLAIVGERFDAKKPHPLQGWRR